MTCFTYFPRGLDKIKMYHAQLVDPCYPKAYAVLKIGNAISSLRGEEAREGEAQPCSSRGRQGHGAGSLKHAGLPQQKDPVTGNSERREKSDPSKLEE